MGITDPGSEAYRDSMSSVVILSCQPNSHPFQERHISLLEPVKIGRSVARARPQSSNGIFDCKVLSRNHAVVWYENGKVRYLFMYYLLMHLCFCSHKSKICTIAWLDKESITVICTISDLCSWKVSSLLVNLHPDSTFVSNFFLQIYSHSLFINTKLSRYYVHKLWGVLSSV